MYWSLPQFVLEKPLGQSRSTPVDWQQQTVWHHASCVADRFVPVELCAPDETGHEALSGPNLEKVLFRGGDAVKGATFGTASLLSFCTIDGTLTIHAHITLHEIANSREEDCVLTANDDLRITGCRSGLRQSFLDLYDHEDIPYDVWLSTSAGGEPEMMVGAHKFVLAARSPVFRAMFSGGLAEAQGYEVNITDFTADAVQAFVRFLYSDLCSDAALQDCANELLAMADKYQVPALSILCERYLAYSLRPESAIGVLKLADAHNVPQLKALALSYLVGNPGRTAEHAQELSAELVRDLLRIVEEKVTGASF
jgi:hypothetical protein